MSSASTPDAPGPDASGETGPSGYERVTTVVSRRVKSGREPDFEPWVHGVIDASSSFPGQLTASVLHDAGTRDYHVLFQFTDQDLAEAWMNSDERNRWLAKLSDMIEEDRGVQQTTGLETWFTLPTSDVPTMKPPPRWKMWAVSLMAVYPLALLFLTFVSPHVSRWPTPIRALLLPFVLLTLMTYVVMPIVTRMARRWLRPPGR